MYEAIIGMNKWHLDTPALLIDLDAMERNIERMARFFREHGTHWRPHSKSHKCPAIAHKLLAAGAIGITCAKLGEAEVMAANGIQDILIANEIVGPQKIARLANLRRHADVMVCVDDPGNVEELGAVAREKGVCIRVLVEVNIGLNRCGTAPGEETLGLARKIANTEGLRFCGLMGYEGHVIMIEDPEEKRARSHEALDHLIRSKDLIEDEGIQVEIISAGGTGDYVISGAYPGVTEIQAGGGIFMDMLYYDRCQVTGHEFALTVLATITSRAVPGKAITDAGMKTMSRQHGIPKVVGREGVEVTSLSAEHGILDLETPQEGMDVGDKIELIVGYSDTTNVLHDRFYGIRDGEVEVVWELLGRGKLQ